MHFALGSSNGLADNPQRTYSELVDVGAPGKGLFAAVEAEWHSTERLHRVGVWFNGRSHVALQGSSTGRSNAGVWGATDWHRGRHAINLRLGFADPEVSAGDRFGSIAFQFDRGRIISGVAVAALHASDDLPSGEDLVLLEAYLSWQAMAAFYVTPSIQHVWNGDLDVSPQANRSLILGLRLHARF